MKYFTILLFFLSISNCVAQDLEEGLQGFYRFNNDLVDLSPNQIEGISVNATQTVGLEETENTAFNFNGSDTFISLGPDSREIKDVVSISAWVRTFSAKRQFVVSKYNSDESIGYFIGVEDGVAFVGGRYNSSEFVQAYGATTINDGEWHHIIGVVDGEDWTIWVDCEIEASTSSISNNSTLDCADPLTIGNWYQGNGYGEFRVFEGVIDEVRIYNRNLLEGDILKLCNQTSVSTDNRLSINSVPEFKISPNPTDSELNIISNKEDLSGYNYRIIDVQKRVLDEGFIFGPISVSNLPAGIYIFQILNDNRSIAASRFIKV